MNPRRRVRVELVPQTDPFFLIATLEACEVRVSVCHIYSPFVTFSPHQLRLVKAAASTSIMNRPAGMSLDDMILVIATMKRSRDAMIAACTVLLFDWSTKYVVTPTSYFFYGFIQSQIMIVWPGKSSLYVLKCFPQNWTWVIVAFRFTKLNGQYSKYLIFCAATTTCSHIQLWYGRTWGTLVNSTANQLYDLFSGYSFRWCVPCIDLSASSHGSFMTSICCRTSFHIVRHRFWENSALTYSTSSRHATARIRIFGKTTIPDGSPGSMFLYPMCRYNLHVLPREKSFEFLVRGPRKDWMLPQLYGHGSGTTFGRKFWENLFWNRSI